MKIPRIMLLLVAISLSSCLGGGGGSDNTIVATGTPYSGNLFDVAIAGGAGCNGHLTAGDPGSSDQTLCRDGYAVGYNYTKKIANWVAYHTTSSSVTPSITRNDNFRQDGELPSMSSSTLSDYSGSGYDRGHLAPAATMDFSYASMDQSFLLSNITPQLPDFNRAGWASLEDYVRSCTVEKGELYVFTGPVFNSSTYLTIGNGVAVPDAYYTVMIKPDSPATGFAFLVPHQAVTSDQLENYVTSIDKVEAKTGLDFFSAVRNDVENPIESSSTPICALPWKASTGGGGGGGSVYTCGTKTTCGQMASCAEAYYFLNTCGVSKLDGDKDGVPCESICN